MFCPKCGAEIDDKAVMCVNCGSTVTPMAPVGIQPMEDNPSTLLKIVCFLVPIVGLILYLVMKDTRPVSAKAYGKWALISVIVSVVLGIIGGCAGLFAIGDLSSDYYYLVAPFVL